MEHESLRSIARRLVQSYRARHALPADPAAEEKMAEAMAAGAAQAQQARAMGQRTVADLLADDRALWFDLMLTDQDAQFLKLTHIDVDGV